MQLRTERLLHHRPFLLCRAGHMPCIGNEGLEPAAVVEQKEAAAADQPDFRLTGHRNPARDSHRVVTAKSRHIDVRPLGEGRAITGIAEAPDRAAILQFKIRMTRHCPAVGMEGDRIVAADGEPGVAIDDESCA